MNFHLSRFVTIALVGFTLSAGPACKHRSTPPEPPPPPVDAPSVACPATVVADVQEAPASVQYPAPVVTGGSVPVTVSCTIATGATFPAGLTDIICTATDSLSRRAQCTFQVQVNIIAKLKGAKFMAFGDSITEGQVSDPVPIPGFRAVDKVNNYPTQLQGMLLARYPSQIGLISVINEGVGGKQLVDDDEQERFIAAVRSTRPDAVLFLEGTNDLNVATAAEIGNAIKVTIQRAIRENVKVVFVSTLLPQVFGRPKGGHPEAILEANEEIRAAVASQGPNAVLVDSFAAINPDKARLIGQDGLHPTVEGYKVLAETFLAAIKANFEAPPAPTRR